MPSIRQISEVHYSCEQMFDLVADIKRYPDFLPWVVATRIRNENETSLEADMVVGFKAIRETFTSLVLKDSPSSVRVRYVDGPLRDLDNSWVFRPAGEGRCTIDFAVDFAFRNPVFEALAGRYIDKAFQRMVAAFEARAAELYGSAAAPS